jgi:hypothetical protein
MGHFKTGSTRAEMTHPSWLKTGAQIGELVNEWAYRGDLVVYLGPGAGGPAPAAYNPALSEIEVNTDAAFGKGVEAEVVGDLRDRDTQYDWPRASGAIFHEACHARYSRWSMEAAHGSLSSSEFEALQLLEEGRIEGHGVKSTPANREFLRSCALEIVIGDLDEEGLSKVSTIHAGARLAGLTLARVDAGVLEMSDLGAVPELLEALLGESLLKTLRGLWNEMQMHEDHYDITPMYDVARRWIEAIRNAQTEKGEETQESVDQQIQEILEALADAAGIAEIAAAGELADQQVGEQWVRIAKGRSADSAEEHSHKNVAEKIFTENAGPEEGGKSISKLQHKRPPTSRERAAAVKLGQLFDKAKYRERSQTEIHSVTPPGRLRTRALVQGAALKSKGLLTQTEPWRRTQRKHTDNPQLKVGVMVDISGSMGDAMEPMAVTAWVLSEATKRVQGRAAMVYYGNDVFPTLKPGQNLPEIQVYSAKDGTEKFDKAFKALDGAMNFLHGDGARLLVIVSDGHYTSEETTAATKWIERCHKVGVGVLWLTYDDVYAAQRWVKKNGEVVHVGKDSVDAAQKIGMAAVKVLSNASAARR